MADVPDRRRYGVMSREITVTDINGLSSVHKLSIATFDNMACSVDNYRQGEYVYNLEIEEYKREIAGIEYIDRPVEFIEVEKAKWKISIR